MVRVLTVRAFTKQGKGGNPAGVCLSGLKDEPLTERQMQHIATQMKHSETAFVLPATPEKDADFHVRFFTVEREVPLCGHATIATFHALWKNEIAVPRRYTQETGAGILEVEITEDGRIFMDQKPPEFLTRFPNREEVADALNTVIPNLVASLPPRIVSTGFPALLVPMASLAALLRLGPSMEKVAALSKKYGALVYAFSRDQHGGVSSQARMFDPLDGIPEEAATGTAAGALACYLSKFRLVKDPSNIVIEQGHALHSVSEIIARLTVEETDGQKKIRRVVVGGQAAIESEREIELPAAE